LAEQVISSTQKLNTPACQQSAAQQLSSSTAQQPNFARAKLNSSTAQHVNNFIFQDLHSSAGNMATSQQLNTPTVPFSSSSAAQQLNMSTARQANSSTTQHLNSLTDPQTDSSAVQQLISSKAQNISSSRV